ncbi:MAG: type II toxin-antitoxin system VapC family toxin [Promethearchaeota archaeon]
MKQLNSRVYVDVNIFLNPILYDSKSNPEAARAEEFLKKIVFKDVEAFTSIISWDELVWVVRKLIGRDISIKKGQEFLIFPNLNFIHVTSAVVRKAQDLIKEYNIKPRDAIHVSSALLKNLAEIITFDEDFAKIPLIKSNSLD